MIELVKIESPDDCADPELRVRAVESSTGRYTQHYLLREEGHDVAFVALDLIPNADYLVLYELWIPRALRGNGIGGRALFVIEQFAKDHERESVVLTSRPLECGFSTKRLVAWYMRHGYTKRVGVPDEMEKLITARTKHNG